MVRKMFGKTSKSVDSVCIGAVAPVCTFLSRPRDSTLMRSLGCLARLMSTNTSGLVAIVACIGVAGCTSQSSTNSQHVAPATTSSASGSQPAAAPPEHEHAHGHGPHGGHLVDLGSNDYHAELTFASGGPVVSVYTLGADPAKVVAIDAPSITIVTSVEGKVSKYEVPANRQSDDPPNKSSCFELTNEDLYRVATGNDPAPTPRLRIGLTIDGLPYAGEVDVHEHTHNAAGHSHSHGADDALIWQQEVTDGDFKISLGHHGVQLLAGANVEPAVQITRGDKPVGDAVVFNSLLNATGGVIAPEVPTKYEPPSADEPSHYAQGRLKIPPGTRDATIRFRVILPENKGERTFDVPVKVR